MKFLLMSTMLLFSSLGFSADDVEVKLDLNLYMDKLCDDNQPFCSSLRSFGGAEIVTLSPQYGDTMACNDDGECDEPYHFRGIWSQVVEKDGLRAIAIVSIDRYRNINSDGKTYFDFNISGEIIGDKGLEAKINLSTQDLSNLNSIDLEGDIHQTRFARYQAVLHIAKPLILDVCIPNDDSNEDPNSDPENCDDVVASPTPPTEPLPGEVDGGGFVSNSQTKIEVLLGTLR